MTGTAALISADSSLRGAFCCTMKSQEWLPPTFLPQILPCVTMHQQMLNHFPRGQSRRHRLSVTSETQEKGQKSLGFQWFLPFSHSLQGFSQPWQTFPGYLQESVFSKPTEVIYECDKIPLQTLRFRGFVPSLKVTFGHVFEPNIRILHFVIHQFVM